VPTPITPYEISENPFRLIAQDWMLITAGPPQDFNTMTASWGGVGHIWGKDVCWCVVRPVHHPFGFMERNSGFTLTISGEEHRQLSHGGLHHDRLCADELGFHPRFPVSGSIRTTSRSTRGSRPGKAHPDNQGRSPRRASCQGIVRRPPRTLPYGYQTTQPRSVALCGCGRCGRRLYLDGSVPAVTPRARPAAAWYVPPWTCYSRLASIG
jgi:hypothetical protein